MDDGKIIELFFARSEDAIMRLDEKYGAKCRKLSRNILSDSRDVEECVNDSYLGVWNSVPPAKPNPLAAFLYRIVRNLSLKRYRDNNAAKRSTSCTDALDEIGDIFSGSETVEDEVARRELVKMIEEFLDTLPRENRVIFLRRYWYSEPYADIAKRVGMSEKNVSVRLTRIREKLRVFLIDRGIML